MGAKSASDARTKGPIVIELAGIPYARKTSIFSEIQARAAQRRDVRFHFVEEYRGDELSYDKTKIGPTLNIHRALYSAKVLRSIASKPWQSVVVLDRGIWDSFVWLDFFELNKSINSQQHLFLKNRLERIFLFSLELSSRYCVNWIDEDVILANSRHNKQGRIINLRNLIGLGEVYSRRFMFDTVNPCFEHDVTKLLLKREVPYRRDNSRIADSILKSSGLSQIPFNL